MYEDFNDLWNSLYKWANYENHIQRGDVIIFPDITARTIAHSMLIPIETQLYGAQPINRKTKEILFDPMVKIIRRKVKFADVIRDTSLYVKEVTDEVVNAIYNEELFIPLPLVENQKRPYPATS